MNSPSLGEDVQREQALITGLSRIQDGVRFNLGMVLALAADKNKSVFTSSPSTIRQGLGHCLLWTNAYGTYFFMVKRLIRLPPMQRMCARLQSEEMQLLDLTVRKCV